MRFFGTRPLRAPLLFAALTFWTLAAAVPGQSFTIGPCDAIPVTDPRNFQTGTCTAVSPVLASSDGQMIFPFRLPSGASVTGVIVRYYDTMAATEPIMEMQLHGIGFEQSLGMVPFPEFSGGANTITVDLTSHGVVIDNAATYTFDVHLHRSSPSEQESIYNIELLYKLQVSPPPAIPTFNDVPVDHPFYRFVEALSASGITAGCGGGNFCPDNPVTRGQMAVFLSKALGLYFPN